MSIGSGIGQLHAWIAAAAALVAGALVVLGLVQVSGIVTGPATRRWIDRGLLVLLVVVACGALVGPLVLLTVGPPADWLHLLYAALAIAVAPLLRLEAGRRRSPRVGAWVALGGLVTLGALLRLWGTGG
jgi:hypothetical protein